MRRMHRSPMFLAAVVLVALVALLNQGCSEKKEFNPEPVPQAIVIPLSVSLNRVPVDLSQFPTRIFQVRNPDGSDRQIRGVRISDWLDGIPGLELDLPNFLFNLVDKNEAGLLTCLGGDQGLLPDSEDLSHAYFCDGSEEGNGLQILWDDARAACFFASNMEGGAIVSIPTPGLVAQAKDLSYVTEMTPGLRDPGKAGVQAAPLPAHLGETVYVEGVATIGSDVMVSGRYLKFHIQDDTAGIYVFADTLATVATAGYDGASFAEIDIYEGDLVFLHGTIGEHNGMVEFYPVSGYELAVPAAGRPVPAPHVFASVDEVYGSGYRQVGELVRVNAVALQGDQALNPWPEVLGTYKDLELQGGADQETLYMDIYKGSGIPGSTPPPQAGFDIVGVLHREVDALDQAAYTLYPRGLYDLSPLDAPQLPGQSVSVYVFGQAEADWVTVDLDTVPQCLYDTGRQGGPGAEPVVSLASLVTSLVTADPKRWEYKIKARDGRQPFEPLDFESLKRGALYQSDGKMNSHFYPTIDLSEIYYLNDVAQLILFPVGAAPQPGDAEHGKGINLEIDGTNYPVNFKDLPAPGLAERPLSDFVPDKILDIYTMGGSFTPEQIRQLYDYRLVPFGAQSGCFPVTWDQIAPLEGDRPVVNLTGGVPVVTGLADCGTITDLFTIEMVRKLEVNGRLLYWQDLPTTIVDLGGGQTEAVVFLRDVLTAAGLSEAERLLYDYFVWAIDDFGTYFPYGHGHLKDMYFNPLTNRGFVRGDYSDEMPAYGGRYSTKAIARIDVRPIDPAGELPVLCAVHGGEEGYLHDPNQSATCNGCHLKKGSLLIPVSCADCHAACP